MRLSSLADYAVVMLSAAARMGPDARLSATDLAAETGVPLPTAQKLLGRLSGAGLLTSVRGSAGGFALARDPSVISLADIVEAVEGPIQMTSCVDEARHDCALEEGCRVRPHWGAVNFAIRSALADVTLAVLAGAPPSFALGLSKGRTSSEEGHGFDIGSSHMPAADNPNGVLA